MTSQPTLGARLKQARRQKAAREGRDYTQATLAAEASIAPVTVSRYESDLQEPSLDMIGRLSTVLGVDPGWLAFGVEPTAPPTAAPLPPAPLTRADVFTRDEVPAARRSARTSPTPRKRSS